MFPGLSHPLAADADSVPCGARVLGGVVYGHSRAVDTTILPVDMPVLAGGAAACSLLLTDAPVRHGVHGPVRYTATDELLFGVVQGDAHGLETSTAAAYGAIFDALDALGFTTLIRAWNYLPDINADVDGVERYRQFNAGRQAAFAASRRPCSGRVPAACALGTRAGPLGIAFLASVTPFVPVENPRQVSAYHYPPAYGALSPTFSRAGLARVGGRDALFISGTAAIVGHASVHAGDIEAQTRETLANLNAVLEAANAYPGALRYQLDTLDYTVYVRQAEDAHTVMRLLREQVGDAARKVCLQADVCRSELLVEIEAMGGLSARGEA